MFQISEVPAFQNSFWLLGCLFSISCVGRTTAEKNLVDTGEEQTLVEVEVISGLDTTISCSASNVNNSGDLSIVIHNADHSMALVYFEKEGYPTTTSQWSFHNENIEMELHMGFDVGRDYCTESIEEGQVSQRFIPISIAALPSEIEAIENPVFSFFLL